MTDRYPKLTLLLLLVVCRLTAQPIPYYNTDQLRQQRAIGQAVRAFERSNYTQAMEKARLLGRPIRQVQPDGSVQQLWGLDERGNLLYEHTHSNARAANTTRTSDLYAGGSLGLSLSGSSPTVRDRIAIWDGGRLQASQVEFAGRVTQMDSPANVDNHATHVAGTMIARGINGLARGMAFGANLKAYDFTGGDTEIADAAGTYLVSNHSYGFTAGWYFNDNRAGNVKWEWHGDTTVSDREDYKFGFYDTRARSWDRIAFNAPYYLLVKSAGNDHGDNGPGDGQPYYLVNRNVISTRPRNDQNGYDQITTNGTAKNILTVGAVGNLTNGYNAASDVRIADFSSWGPTDDGRIKPDISAVGVSVLSTSSRTDSAYAVLSGTSMAAPNVTGSLLLLQELYAGRNDGQFMRASTLKGLILHTANEAGSAPGPDYRFGWGLLNTGRAAQVLLNTDRNHLLSEQSLAQGQTYSLPVVASGRGPLIVTICWHDPEGTATTVSAANLNNRAPKLINDLDVRVSDGRQPSLPWVLNPDKPDEAATTGDNIRDNVEQVVIPNAVPGRSYTVTVTHKGTLTNTKQDYALLASGVGGTIYCASGASSPAGLRIDGVQLGPLNQRGRDTCTTYTDFTRTVTTVQVGQTLPLSVSLGSCGAPQPSAAVVRVFADWNNNGVFEPDDTLATSNVLVAGSVFTRTVRIPATVANDQLIRLRVVCAETTDPASVSACGGFVRGETQDYLLQTVRAANDVGITAIVTPDGSYCTASSTPAVTVRVRNFGTETQRNIPVTVRITDPTSGSTATAGGTVPVLNSFGESLLRIPVDRFPALTTGNTYRISAGTTLVNDQNPANNQLTEDRSVAPTTPTAVSGLSALMCSNDSAVVLRNTAFGTAFWYDALIEGSLLAAGNQTVSRRRQNVFYVGLNSLNTTVGPATKGAFGGGTYAGNFGPAPLISTRVPILLESARIYTGAPGRLTFTVRRLDDVPVSSVSLDVVATRNPSLTAVNASGQLVDDPNDQGAEYPLNLRIPLPGDYKITIEYEGGASIFRSNVGVTGFPYQIRTATGDPIVTLRGALFNATTTRIDTLTNAWYYLYNLRVRSLDCPSPQRVAVTTTTGQPPTVSITADGSTSICRGAGVNLRATADNALSYQWLLNGQSIRGATTASIRAISEGTYAVQVANNCLPTSSSAIQVNIREAQLPTLSLDGLTLRSNATISNQWLLNGVPITGATSQSLLATQTGRYAVRGNVNGCGEAISAEIIVTIVANEDPIVQTVEVFPNPTTQRVTVRIPAQARQQPSTIRLVTPTGQLIQAKSMQREKSFFTSELDLSGQAAGIYFVLIDAETGPTVVRISKL